MYWFVITILSQCSISMDNHLYFIFLLKGHLSRFSFIITIIIIIIIIIQCQLISN